MQTRSAAPASRTRRLEDAGSVAVLDMLPTFLPLRPVRTSGQAHSLVLWEPQTRW